MKPLHARIYQILTILLTLILAALLYKFFTGSTTTPSDDGRASFEVTAAEAVHIQSDMRRFLSAIQQINQGLAEDNMERVSEVATAVGSGNHHSAPITLIAKLPMEFRQLGFSTHSGFSTIATHAEAGEKAAVIEQLSSTIKNCVVCHESFAITVVP